MPQYNVGPTVCLKGHTRSLKTCIVVRPLYNKLRISISALVGNIIISICSAVITEYSLIMYFL